MDLHDWEASLIITRDTPAVFSISVGVWETWNACLAFSWHREGDGKTNTREVDKYPPQSHEHKMLPVFLNLTSLTHTHTHEKIIMSFVNSHTPPVNDHVMHRLDANNPRHLLRRIL